MRITCPSCDAAYDVPESVIASRRMLKCAKCATNFPAFASALGSAPASAGASAAGEAGTRAPASVAPAPVVPAPLVMEPPHAAAQADVAEPLPRLASPIPRPERLAPNVFFPPEPELETVAPPPRRAASLVVGTLWVLSFALLGGLGWAFVAYRQPIVQAWPPSARLYLALGMGK